MPEYLSPGVYVEELEAGPKPIEGVSTSTTGFVGLTERGLVHPRLVTSWLDFQRWYGGFIDPATTYLPYAIKGFFDNGGQRAFIARAHRSDAASASESFVTADAQQLQMTAIGPGDWGGRVFVRISDGSRSGFRITLLYYTEAPPTPLVDPLDPANLTNANRREPDKTEDFDDLGLNPTGPRYVITTVNATSQLVNLQWTDNTAAPSRPTNTEDYGDEYVPLAGGGDGAAALTAADFIGDGTLPANQRTGLAGLEAIDEISILGVPDAVHPGVGNNGQVASELINQCERLRDRFAILSVAGNQGNVANIQPTQDTSYAGIYYPWIRVYDPRTQDTVLIPPVGHVAGIYARTDVERGVHKAPANEVVRGIVTQDLSGNRGPLEFRISKGEHDILNPRGVNAIRDFRADGRGIRVWGARTMSSDGQWKYVNVRRLFLFVEESIDEGTQWVVFEPNDETTWARVSRSITNFLIRVWRSGALMGVTQEEAFFVKCDRTTMTQDDIDNGRLICYIGIAPVKPAEFVIFRISQKTIEAQG